jgi:hypothetical protein
VVTVSESKNLKYRSTSLLRLWAFLFVPTMLVSCGVTLAEQSGESPQANQSSGDTLLGTWRLNTKKSPHSTLESKSVVIESQGNGYKLTIDYVQSNGMKWNFSANTSMKAEVVKTIENDGKLAKQEWRVTRTGSGSFIVEWLGPFGKQEKYDVTADGKTMTIHDVTRNPTIVGFGRDKDGKTVPLDTTEVFDRVLPPPSK